MTLMDIFTHITKIYYFSKQSFEELNHTRLNDLPIKNISSIEQLPFVEKADLILSLTKEFQELSKKFQRSIQRKFELEDLPNKLQDWYKLSYPEFIKELAKKKVKLSLSQEAEWEDYFLEESKKALELKSKIDKTDKQIDLMVYKLYDLSYEEVKIAEPDFELSENEYETFSN